MIKRLFTIVLAVATVTTLTFTGTSSAAEGEDCFSIAFPVGPNSVKISGLRIDVYPEHVQGDVLYYASWALGFTVGRVLCVEGGVITGKVPCYQAKIQEIVSSLDPTNLNFRYIYPNEGGGYTIDGNLLIADATAC